MRAFVSAVSLAPFLVSLPAFAQSSDLASTQLLRDVLDAQQAVATESGDALAQSCGRLEGLIPALQQSARLGSAAEFSQALVAKRCAAPQGETNPSLRPQTGLFADPVLFDSSSASEVEFVPWSEQPFCPTGSRFNHMCHFNHDTGRGLFIFEEPEIRSFPNYLVCASAAGKSSGFFGSGYAITSRCVVSSLDWRAYVHLDPEIRMRSDVQGFVDWTKSDGFLHPIGIPSALAQQCGEAFRGALFCSPQLIVMPTQNPKAFDVCSLQTQRSGINLLFIRISSASSRWDCRRFDLSVAPEPEGVLSVQEQRCVPDFAGDIDPGCDLPYIPRTQQPIRVRRDD